MGLTRWVVCAGQARGDRVGERHNGEWGWQGLLWGRAVEKGC
jgi:hypothetical protein